MILRESRAHRGSSLALFVLAACGASNGDKANSSSPKPGDAGASLDGALPPGTQQYTFTMASFEVPANSELYKCQDVPNPFGEDIAIVETESTMSTGAHHMYAFQIPTTEAAFTPDAGLYAAEYQPVPDAGAVAQTFVPDGGATPLFDCPEGGLEFHPYFHLTQAAHDSITYPKGVGRSLKASEAIRLNIHYLNVSARPIQVGAEVTVSYVKASAVKQLAAGIFVFGGSLKVPTGVSTQTFSYSLPSDMKFLQFTGHMHSRGTYFEAHATSNTTGEVRPLYSSSRWDEPVQLDLAPPFEMNSGDALGYSCTFDNRTGMMLSYGPSAATNEMCNFFGVFYPAANGSTVLGQL
jgi:Copper type II ascorbate-dependent monooxygenase, C-terminal domain